MARQSQKSGTIKTTNPQSVTLAGTIQPFAGDTSSWPVINGVRQKLGWAVCEGDVLEQATYSQLFANLGSTWNAFNHPADGTPTVGGSQFALPNLKGLYLGGAGANGDSTFALGSFAADLTGVNGLSNSSSSVSVSGTTADDTHNHGITDPGHTHSLRAGAGSGPTTRTQIDPNNSSSYVYGTTDGNSTGITINNDTHSHTFTASGTASAQTISGDAETRPKTAPVGYIIALYDSVAAGALGLPEATADVSGIVTRNQVAEAGRNYIINGGFEINQRGDKTVADAVSGYVQDRWVMAASGANYTSQVLDLGDNSEFSKYLRMEATTANDNWGFYQRIENVRTLAGKEATLSFYARSDNSSITNVNLVYSQIFGTGGTPSAIKTVFLPQISLTSSWQKFELTFNVDEIASKTIGTDGNDYLEIGFIQADGVVTGRFDFREIKLEEGTVATKFTRAGGTYAGELALCQRYYETGYTGFYGASGSRIGGSCQYAVKKRKATTFTSQVNIAGAGVTSISVNTSQDLGSFYWISNAGLTIGTSTQHTFTWQADAEL